MEETKLLALLKDFQQASANLHELALKTGFSLRQADRGALEKALGRYVKELRTSRLLLEKLGNTSSCPPPESAPVP